MLTVPKAITFDCYGTLIDWESAIQRFFAESMDSKGLGYVDPKTLQTEWEEIQFQYIQEKFRRPGDCRTHLSDFYSPFFLNSPGTLIDTEDFSVWTEESSVCI